MRQFINIVTLTEDVSMPEQQRFWYDPKKDELYTFTNGHHVHHALSNKVLRAALKSALTPEQEEELFDQAEAAIDMRDVTMVHNRVMSILGDLGFMRGGYDPMNHELYIEYKGNDPARQYRNARKLMRHFNDVRLLTVEVWNNAKPDFVLLQNPEAIERFRKFGSTRTSLGEDVQSDPDDHFKPVLMREPKVLYRSVSLPELVDIWANGAVFGGRNEFNGFDPRKHVFFGDDLSKEVIYQGEEIDRQAHFALGKEQIALQMRVLVKDIQDQERYLISLAKEAIKTDPRAADLLLRLEHDEFGTASTISRFYMRGPAKQEYDATYNRIRELRRELDDLHDEFREQHAAKMDELKRWRENFPITSAVIVTKPISGGLHYSKLHGKSGMSGDEYGFAPGAVTMYNIAKIVFIKDGKPVGELNPYDDVKLGRYLEKIGLVSE